MAKKVFSFEQFVVFFNKKFDSAILLFFNGFRLILST